MDNNVFKNKKKWLVGFLLLVSIFGFVLSDEEAAPGSDDDLSEAESARSKLEIVKQIKKINEDGSYTIGYEADDGSFKIESRDVLGNIKGTYGFIDDNGEIKRVTYSTKNESDAKYTTPSVVQRIPRVNRTYASILRKQEKSSSVSTSVVQNIPNRRRFVFPAHTSTTPKTSISSSKTVDVVYAQSVPSSEAEGQLTKPSTQEVPSTEASLQKHTLETSLSEIDSTIKPVTEESEIHGNTLRRQLFPDRRPHPQYDPRLHNLALQQNSDFSDVYSGSKTHGNPRPPLFTTTDRPRSLPIISTTPKVVNSTPFVIKPGITTPSPRNTFVIPQYPEVERTTTETVPENEAFKTQIPFQGVQTPPYLPTQQRLAAVQNPTNGELILVPAGHPLLSHYAPNGQNVYINPTGEAINGQNLYQANTRNSQNIQIMRAIPIESNGISSDQNVIYGTLVPVTHRSSPVRVSNVEYDLQRQIDEIEPPVSVNDFQKILDQLIIRQKKLETVNSIVNSQIQDPLAKATMIIIQPRIPYQPMPYRQRSYNPNVPQDQSYAQSKTNTVQNNIDRRGVEEKFLPPIVRENLLLKMLKLAINPYLPLEADTEAQYSATPNPTIIKTGQRNVEILGEENEEHNNSQTYRRNN